MVRAGKHSQFVKVIRQEKDQQRLGKKDFPAKDKAAAIYMIQSWQRVTRQKVTKSFDRIREIVFPPLTANEGAEGPIIIEAEIGGHTVHRMYVDGGSSMEVLFEHCFNRLRPEIQSQMTPATTSLTGFSGETIWPIGQIRLLVTIGDAKHSTEAWMNFMIVRSPSPYKGIIGRPGIKEIQAVPSMTHEMIKFRVKGGVVTIRSTIFSPMECATVTATLKSIEEKTKKCLENFQVAIHPDFPDQDISIGRTLSAKGRTKLCALLKRDLDIFAWQPSDMTGVPRSIAEHKLNIRNGYSPVRQKKRGQARAKAIQAEVQKLVEVGIMREVYYHDWLSNLVMVKKHDGSWRMCVDFTDLNKACLHTEEEMLRDIEETFRTLMKINMKLNPKKCTFGAVKGMFLGYMVGPEGIKPCLDKVDVVLQLLSPRTIKEVQSLSTKTAGGIDNVRVRLSWSGWRSANDRKRHGSDAGQILADFLVEKLNDAPADTSVKETPKEIAAQMGVRHIQANVDSNLVSGFDSFSISHVSRSKNKKADALSKIASTNFVHLSKQVLVEILNEKSINEKEVAAVVEEEESTWMTPIVEYLRDETLPEDRKDASKLRIKARQYELLQGVLYRRSFLKPWLQCVRPLQADYF
ncbi:reverse transcriptase domain-containing protein [Tanacetum coccineum]